MDPWSPLSATVAGTIISMLATANVVQWREIRKLNAERLQDIKEIGEVDRKIIKGATIALDNLRRKINGISGSKKT